MATLGSFFRKMLFKYKIAYFYKHQDLLVELEFANRTDKKKSVWVEPTCGEFEIDANTEYRIVTHDKFFRIEFDSENSIVFYLQHSFGFKLYKRPVSKELTNKFEWQLDQDTSDIQIQFFDRS